MHLYDWMPSFREVDIRYNDEGSPLYVSADGGQGDVGVGV